MMQIGESLQKDPAAIVDEATNHNSVPALLLQRLRGLPERHVTSAIIAKRTTRTRREADHATDNDDVVAGIEQLMPCAIEHAQAAADHWRTIAYPLDLNGLELFRGTGRKCSSHRCLPVAEDVDAEAVRCSQNGAGSCSLRDANKD